MKYEEIINNRFSEPAAVISYKDGNIGIAAINDKYLPEHWMNVAEDDYIRSYPHKGFDEDNLSRFLKAVERCVSSGQEQEVETWRSVFSDCCGFDKVCLKSRLVLIEKESDEAFVYESIRNISNEKRTLDVLDDIEYRYKQASEQINIYNWEYVIDTKEMRPCYRCMRDLGVPALVSNYPEPLIDMGIFPPDYADMYRDLMKQIDEGVPEIEADVPLTVGRVPFRIKYTTSFDENGKPVKAFGSATLISDTELGQIKLDNQIIASLAEEYRCIYLVDFVKNSVKIVKQEDIMTLPEGADCQNLLDLLISKLQDTPEKSRQILNDISLVRSEMFRDSAKREFVYKDETTQKWIRVEIQALEKDEDIVDRLIVTVFVIDDLRAEKMDAERLIASQKKELEDRQQVLLSAVEEANRANKAKTDFFANMTHDLRTPMNAIMGFSKLAVDEIDEKDHLEDYLGKIRSAGDHLLNLINDILDMSRLESGKMEIQEAPVRLKDLISECADMIRVKMDENGLDFSVDIDELGDDTVECDRLRFNQVLINLLSNAYKFTPRGGSVTLSGKLKERGEKLNYEIRVKDTGIGMSEHFREHIWDAYSRENSETVHETQGTGLGMLIVRNIVNLMHGSIDVISAPGKGSEFVMVLALTPVNTEGADDQKKKAAEDAMSRDYSGIRVLVVDDTSMNRRLAQLLLTKYGFTVRTTDNGIDAIRQVEESKPGEINLILMDVNMPVMSGLEATKRLRALNDQALSSIPIIAMTANAFEEDINEALEAGMNAYIPKPFTPEELLTVISASL